MRKITTKLLLSPFVILFSTGLLTINAGCSSSEKDEDKAVTDFEITEITNVTETSAVINADLKSSGKENILYRGICIAMETNPTINDMKQQEEGNVLGQLILKFENLQHNTKFYARPYLTTNSKTIYGNELSFTTKNISIPTLTTFEVTSISQNSATFSGKIENDGSSKILSKGFYYSRTNSKPEYNDQKNESSGNVEFSSAITNLEPNTTYYVRAFASNLAGTALGQVVSFKTNSFVLPAVSTADVTSILETSAVVGGTVTDEGSNPVTERGVCYDDLFPQPTIASNHIKVGAGLGFYTSSIATLQPFKNYYIRAYAISAAGIAYGSTVYIKTIGGDKPTVQASASANKNTVYITVKVLKQGSDNITAINAKCFDMDGNSVGKLVSGSGWNNSNIYAPVTFEISGLSTKNRYYIVGYASNGVGTGASERIYVLTL